MEHVCRQRNHGKVINDENHFEINRFLVFHQARTGPDHKEVTQEDERHRDGGVHQQPRVRPLVWRTIKECVRTSGTQMYHSPLLQLGTEKEKQFCRWRDFFPLCLLLCLSSLELRFAKHNKTQLNYVKSKKI